MHIQNAAGGEISIDNWRSHINFRVNGSSWLSNLKLLSHYLFNKFKKFLSSVTTPPHFNLMTQRSLFVPLYRWKVKPNIVGTQVTVGLIHSESLWQHLQGGDGRTALYPGVLCREHSCPSAMSKMSQIQIEGQVSC